jgi:stearoyl-CoA desaturase (delta-9 desaturase)
LIVGFFWSTVLVYHATFCINSLAHVRGRRRYVTGDDSRNNWLLAIFTMGEGWHNNHHAYQSSVRQGFRWWEIDPTFYILKMLSWFGLVWDLAIQESLANAQNRAADVLASFYLPQLPTRREIVNRAVAMFAETSSMDAIVSRAHMAILEAICMRLSAIALQTKPAAATS